MRLDLYLDDRLLPVFRHGNALEFISDVASFVFFNLDRFLLDYTFTLMVRSKMMPPP
jgi:hypothetical protein